MNDPIIHVIHDFAVAEHLRSDLLAAGLAAADVILSPIGDEAGPGQSNFTVGDSPQAKGGTDYDDVFRPEADHHGACILKILPRDPSQHDQAQAIITRHRDATPTAIHPHTPPQ